MDLELSTVDRDGGEGGEVHEREDAAVVGVEAVLDGVAQEVVGVEEGRVGRFVDVDGIHGVGIVTVIVCCDETRRFRWIREKAVVCRGLLI